MDYMQWKISPQVVTLLLSACSVLWSVEGRAEDATAPPPGLRDQGWTSPWVFAGEADAADKVLVQSAIALEGDMALVSTATAVIERSFPPVSSGRLKIEMAVRLENPNIGVTHHNVFFDPAYDELLAELRKQIPTLGLNHPSDSVLKVYAADSANRWAFRWHCPYAWPEAGGNAFPRFYVIDGKGSKRKGLEPTDFAIEADTWYRVAAVLHFEPRHWEFFVDGVKFDAPGKFGRDMAWWQSSADVSKIRLTFVYGGRNWIDSIRIWHDDREIATCGFNGADGYAAGKPVAGRPASGEGPGAEHAEVKERGQP